MPSGSSRLLNPRIRPKTSVWSPNNQQAAAPRHEVIDHPPLALVPDLGRVDQHEDPRRLQIGGLDSLLLVHFVRGPLFVVRCWGGGGMRLLGIRMGDQRT